MKRLKMFAIDVLWHIPCAASRFADWLSEQAYAACEALEAAYVRLEYLEDDE